MRNYAKFTVRELDSQQRQTVVTERFVFFDDEKPPHALRPSAGETISIHHRCRSYFKTPVIGEFPLEQIKAN